MALKNRACAIGALARARDAWLTLAPSASHCGPPSAYGSNTPAGTDRAEQHRKRGQDGSREDEADDFGWVGRPVAKYVVDILELAVPHRFVRRGGRSTLVQLEVHIEQMLLVARATSKGRHDHAGLQRPQRPQQL